MAYIINQNDVLNRLHNLMGKRVSPGGTNDDLKLYIQDSFDYCWRYYKWPFAMKNFTTLVDGLLPTDFDLDGYSSVNASTYDIRYDTATGRLILNPIGALTGTYQMAPPTLGSTIATSAPFPSAQVVALGALVFAKKAENPTRADVQQEWDLFHAELKKLAARSYNSARTRPTNFHDAAGTYPGDVGS